MRRRILFLTGTRADFGKLKPLIQGTSADPELDYLVVATGMHLEDRYGRTEIEIMNAGFKNVVSFSNAGAESAMDLALARTISGLSPIVKSYRPDLLVVHGDRGESLAGAITGVLSNVLVAHIEGGEFSGTVDELMRHSITKLSHIHYVANEAARDVVLQLGENPQSIWMIGSPEVDLMLSSDLPSLSSVKTYYDITFDDLALLVFHPVTTEPHQTLAHFRAVTDAVRRSGLNYVALYPNNDHGSATIIEELLRLSKAPNIRLIPSMRFEAFQTLLKHALFIVGNSSSGVREAAVHGTPAVNVGSRQARRNSNPMIIDVGTDADEILHAIKQAQTMQRAPSMMFGDGRSAHRFIESLHSDQLWSTPLQKVFHRK